MNELKIIVNKLVDDKPLTINEKTKLLDILTNLINENKEESAQEHERTWGEL